MGLGAIASDARQANLRICAPQAELKMQGVNNVRVNNLSPGMVTTELLLSGAHFPV